MKQMVINKSITPRDSQVLDRYYKDIAQYSLLTADEEISLAQRIHTGDKAALDKLVKSNLRFVISVAKQFQHQGLDLADLISAGNIGLMEAAKRFDETRGFKFCSYAVWWIRKSILDALQQANIVSLPANQMNTLAKAREVIVLLQQELERMPTEDEIRERLSKDYGLDKVNLSGLGLNTVSLDKPVSDDDNAPLSDYMADDSAPKPDDALMNESRRVILDEALCQLSNVEQDILRQTFGLTDKRPLTLNEMSMRIGLCRERVRQLQKQAIAHLKNGPYRHQLQLLW